MSYTPGEALVLPVLEVVVSVLGLLVVGLLLACRPDGGDSCEGSGPCDTGLPVDSDDTDPIDTDTDFDTDTDTDTDTDADSDSDTDTDTDTDADSDSDTDTDSDTATEEPWVLSCDTGVVPDEPCTVAADGSGTYTTIQDAVDAASEGDVITVCPGIYDAVSIDTVGVTLQGYGADSTCIFGVTGTAITVEDATFDISGFTLWGDADDPAAIVASDATGTFHDLRVAGVEPGASASRTAAIASYSELTWEDVTFEHNLVDVGLEIWGGTNTIRHSVWHANGFGIFASYGTSYEGTVEVTNCIFTQNGNGIRLYTDTVTTTGGITNNVFYANGAGVTMHELGTGVVPPVRNNVAYANTNGFEGDISDSDYNVAFGNSFEDFSGYTGTHDASVDPLFEDPANGDFRLQPTSPLVDGGDPDSGYDDADGSRNDIGAFGGPYGDWTP